MRKLSGIMLGAALASGLVLVACPPAGAADITTDAGGANAGADFGPSGKAHLREAAIALRAQWLARGHSVQELATTAPPAITGGSVTKTKITVGSAGEFPSLSVSYTTDTPGLSFVAVEFVSPSGQTAYAGSYTTAYYTQSGTLKFSIVTPVSLYAAPGKWSLADATLVDNAGNTTTYDAQQLKALFTNLSFTVVNTGPAAKAAPIIKGGQLLNTTVSRSAAFPVLAANITATDFQGPGIYQAFVIISPPGGAYSYYSFLPNAKPVKSGAIKANNVFDASSPTGTWSIVGYGVCDYAFNCTGSKTDSDIVALFGTDSFTITP